MPTELFKKPVEPIYTVAVLCVRPLLEPRTPTEMAPPEYSAALFRKIE